MGLAETTSLPLLRVLLKAARDAEDPKPRRHMTERKQRPEVRRKSVGGGGRLEAGRKGRQRDHPKKSMQAPLVLHRAITSTFNQIPPNVPGRTGTPFDAFEAEPPPPSRPRQAVHRANREEIDAPTAVPTCATTNAAGVPPRPGSGPARARQSRSALPPQRQSIAVRAKAFKDMSCARAPARLICQDMAPQNKTSNESG